MRAVIPTLVAVNVAEERVHIRARGGYQPGSHTPTQSKRGDHTEQGYEKGRRTDLQHLDDRRLQPHLEGQKKYADASEHVERRIGFPMLDTAKAENRQVPEKDADEKLPQNRRLAQSRRQIAG